MLKKNLINNDEKKMLKNFHVDLIYRFQKQFNLSNYSMLWISYIEGIVLGFVFGFIIFKLF